MILDQPVTWTESLGWHPDWDGDWQVARLRDFAMALLDATDRYKVELDPVEQGYVRVLLSCGDLKVGEVWLSHTPGDRSKPVYSIYLGTAGRMEYTAYSVGQAVGWLTAEEAEPWGSAE